MRPDTDLRRLRGRVSLACLPPIALVELLSDPKLPTKLADLFQGIPVLTVGDGFWARAGLLRARMIARRRRARLADTLIAQSCLDHDVALITRDADFRHFAEIGRLKLAL